MRLLVFSDLHMEHRPDWSIPKSFPDYDVAVIAGDVGGSPLAALQGLSKETGLSAKPIIFVAGNHEFYGGGIEARLDEARSFGDPRMHLLDRDAVVIDGVRFVGVTLWSAHDFGDPRRAEVIVNDHKMIDGWTIDAAIERHEIELAAIQTLLDDGSDGKTVVVTHHAPSHRSIHVKYRGSKANGAFASNWEATIRKYGPELWIHGHVHDSFDYRIAGTRVLCKPKGYGPDRGRIMENDAFDPNLIVEI